MENLPIYLIVTSYFPTPKSWRCAFVLDQAKAIVRTGRYRVIVVNTNAATDYEYEGIPVIALQPLRRGSFALPWLYDWLNGRRMLRAIKSHGVDLEDVEVVHSHLIMNAMFACAVKRANRQVVSLVQFHDLDPYGTLLSNARYGMCGFKRVLCFSHHRSLAERLDAVVVISRNVMRVAREFPRQSIGCEYLPMRQSVRELVFCRSARIRKFVLLHNGVDGRMFRALPKDERKEGCFTVGCIGNFYEGKSQITLLRAVDILAKDGLEVSVKFVGSGDQLEACRSYVREHGLQDRVCFRKEMLHEKLVEFYRSLDLFVLPSYFEGFGCVFTESWSCGVPFITCEGQGMDDLIYPEDRHLWLCKQRDPEDLAQKILYYYENRPQQRLAAETDIDVTVPKFLDEVEKL